MRAQLQGAVIAVFEERLAVNAKDFFYLLGRDPTWMLSHGSGSRYLGTLHGVKTVSTVLSKFLSCFFAGKNA